MRLTNKTPEKVWSEPSNQICDHLKLLWKLSKLKHSHRIQVNWNSMFGVKNLNIEMTNIDIYQNLMNAPKERKEIGICNRTHFWEIAESLNCSRELCHGRKTQEKSLKIHTWNKIFLSLQPFFAKPLSFLRNMQFESFFDHCMLSPLKVILKMIITILSSRKSIQSSKNWKQNKAKPLGWSFIVTKLN